MTNFLVSTSLFTLLPRPYYYDAGNVWLIQPSFKDNLASCSYKACAELHTTAPIHEVDSLAFFKAMLAFIVQ